MYIKRKKEKGCQRVFQYTTTGVGGVAASGKRRYPQIAVQVFLVIQAVPVEHLLYGVAKYTLVLPWNTNPQTQQMAFLNCKTLFAR